MRPDKVSPWKIEPASSPPVNSLPLSKVKRPRPNAPQASPESPILTKEGVAAKVDIDSAQAQRSQNNMVLQGQEQMTLRNSITDSNDFDATVHKPMMRSPSSNAAKAHPLTFPHRPPMDNWMQLGRRETEFKDACLGSQSFGDSQGFFVRNFDEAPNRLISFKNQFQDQGSTRHFSEPYFFIPPQPSLIVESNTQMHTESKDLLFRNGHNTMYAKSVSPLTLAPPPLSGNSCSPAPPATVGSVAVGITSSGHHRGRPWLAVPCCPCSRRTVTTVVTVDVDDVVNLKVRHLGKSHTDALMRSALSP
ncbi:hypothetical protein GUJ93_ZPchr0013g35953 [Zizania palustris]|uniref:Uncharacterized protein n=1 Tax=Zizania palustris TaxID=103762 RepID=A0A8J5X2E9_ZIZPA|nr:hypothetical protein GUJ93_ZPchr0013g35953 [Zizania palustris]